MFKAIMYARLGSERLARLIRKYNSDKANPDKNYHVFYHELLGPIRKEVADVMEIGLALWKEYIGSNNEVNPDVKTSLRIWTDYFPKAHVVGIDKNDYSHLTVKRATIYRADQGDERALLALRDDVQKEFDVIIDDGSHVSNHQQLTLECLFPLLRPGGYYFVEDLHLRFKYDNIETGVRTIDMLDDWQSSNWTNPAMDPMRFEFLRDNIASIEFNETRRLAAIKRKS